jgi:hypothetical protein
LAPSAPKAAAQASPMPEVAPVTKTTLSLNFICTQLCLKIEKGGERRSAAKAILSNKLSYKGKQKKEMRLSAFLPVTRENKA